MSARARAAPRIPHRRKVSRAIRRRIVMDVPITVIDFADDRARCGRAIDGRPSAPDAARTTRVRARGVGGETTRAVMRGRVERVDGLECVLRRTLEGDLGWGEGSEGYACACERYDASASTREGLTRMFFEEFNASGLAYLDGCACALYACGKTSGVSVEVGESETECACVIDGATATATGRRVDAGGAAMDAALKASVEKKQGIELDDATATAIRRALGKCASSREEYEALARGCATVECERETFTMPDGSVLKLTNELYECGEALMPIVDELCESVQKCPPDARRLVLDGVFVHGVASKVSGFSARLLNELMSALPPSLAPIFATIPDYMPETTWSHAPWTGAALVSKVVFSTNQHISKSDYNENGPPVSHRGR